ncbi:hypothetical protein WA171_000537 [Blastocystis sp. BT1]
MNTNNDNPIVTVTDASEPTPTLKGSSIPPPIQLVGSTSLLHSTSQESPVSTTITNVDALGSAGAKREQETVRLPKTILSTPIRSKDQLVARIKEELSHKKELKQDIEGIEFGNIESKNALVFTLDSCTEKRNAVWSYRLFEGEYDPPLMGPAPKMEEISIIPADYYHSFKFSTPIPHTDFLVRCDHCNGLGHVSCKNCKGNGYTVKHQDNGNNAYTTCGECSGIGELICSRCELKGRIVVFVDLQVDFVNYQKKATIGGGGLSAKILMNCEKRLLWSQEADHLLPPTEFPDQSYVTPINNIFKYSCKRDETLLRQRFSIFEVPVARVSAVLDGNEFGIYVYGEDSKVCFQNYPASTQKNCTIF